MRKRAVGHLILVSGAALVFPHSALGNVIVPAMMDMVMAPLPFGPFEFGALILLVIAALEAVIVNWLAKAHRLFRLFLWLSLANVTTAFVGSFLDLRPSGRLFPVWWMVAIAFLLSAAIESRFAWRVLRPAGCEFRRALWCCTVANGVSYGALLAIVICLTAPLLPALDPTGLRGELRGAILVYHGGHRLSAIDLPSCRIRTIATNRDPYTHGFHASSTGPMFLVDKKQAAYEVRRDGEDWVVEKEPTPVPGRLLAVGAGGSALVCADTTSVVIANAKGGTNTVPVQEGVPIRGSLSHDGRFLAYTVMDPFSWERGLYPENAPRDRGPQSWRGSGEVHLQDLVSGMKTSNFGFLHGYQMGFHPQSNLLARAAPRDTKTRIWEVVIEDLTTGQSSVVGSPESRRVISNIAWSPDGEFLAFMCAHGPVTFAWRGWDASLWVVEKDGRRSAGLPVRIPDSNSGNWNVAWRHD